MKDFKRFLGKILSPMQDQGPAQPAAAAIRRKSAPRKLADAEIRQRYVQAVNAFFEDAVERSATQVFADVLAWKLAAVAFHGGPQAAGDIIRKLGAHLVAISAAEDAQREAKQSRKAGHRPN
jgi:hypothetical protein